MFRDTRRVRQLLGLMILTSITLITVDYRGGANSPFRGVRRSAGNVFGPVERGVSSAVRPIGNALSALGNVGSSDRDIKRLRAQLTAVEGQSHLNDKFKHERDDAMALLKLLNGGQYSAIAAHVIAAAPSNFTWTVTIDAGSDRGIRRNQTVVNGNGLVGRVLEVSKFSSTVLLAIDLKSRVGAQLSLGGEPGLVSGNGSKQLKFEVGTDTPVKAGQALVTTESTFVRAVPIGEVVSSHDSPGATTRTVVIKPYVDFSKLDLIAVLVEQVHPTSLDVIVPDAAKSPPSGPPPCRAASSASSVAPSAAASSSAQWVPCLSSMPAEPAAPAAPSSSPSP